MNLAEAIAAETTTKGPPCSVGLLLETVDDKTRGELLAAIGNPAINGAQLSRAIARAELGNIKPTTLLRHRKRECGCLA